MDRRAARERLRRERDELSSALAAVSERLGTCTVCGSTIPDERLEILPETPYCVKDAAKEERET